MQSLVTELCTRFRGKQTTPEAVYLGENIEVIHDDYSWDNGRGSVMIADSDGI